jgi:hypothetical protein
MNLSLKRKIDILALLLTIGSGSIVISPANAEVAKVLLQGESYATKGVNVTVGQQMQAQAIILTSLSDYSDVSLGRGVKTVNKQIIVFAGQDPCTKYAKSKKARLGTPKTILQTSISDNGNGDFVGYSGTTEIPILTRTRGKTVGPLTDLGTVCIMHYSYSVRGDKMEGIGSFGFTVRESISGKNGAYATFGNSFPVTLSGYLRSAEIMK